MFRWLKKKTAQQSLFNVEMNTGTLIAIANRAYPDDPQQDPDDSADKQVLKAQRSLLKDILFALDGASLSDGCLGIETAKTKEGSISATAHAMADMVIDEVAGSSLAHFSIAFWAGNGFPTACRQGLPAKVVQHQLGHSTIAMTMGTYGYLFPSDEDAG